MSSSALNVDTTKSAPATKADEESPTSAMEFFDEESLKDQVRQRMKAVVHGISAPFASGDKVALDAVPAIDIAGDTIVIQPAKSNARKDNECVSLYDEQAEMLQQQPKDLEALISKMPKAVFGQGNQTVYDTSVRSALQLKAEHFEINIPQAKIDEILSEIKHQLKLQTDLVAERYSLNVYEQGGKFAKHKDTPRGEDMVGTLILCLPSLFKGGEMTVSMGQDTNTYFSVGGGYSNIKGGITEWWTDYSRKEPDPKIIPWCAFFADVDHEIRTVDAGVRVTVAYLLRRKDHQSAAATLPRPIESKEQTDLLKNEFQSVLQDHRLFSDSGGTIGIPCMHLYTNGQVFPGASNSQTALAPKSIKKLKGRDLLIAQAASAVGLEVYLAPYVSHDYSLDGEGDFKLSKFPTKKVPKRMSDDRIKNHFTSVGVDQPNEIADLWILDYGEGAEKCLGSAEYSADGYFGNEASDVDFYVRAALLVKIPEYQAGRAEMANPTKKRKAA